jgi:hypothetical protein
MIHSQRGDRSNFICKPTATTPSARRQLTLEPSWQERDICSDQGKILNSSTPDMDIHQVHREAGGSKIGDPLMLVLVLLFMRLNPMICLRTNGLVRAKRAE